MGWQAAVVGAIGAATYKQQGKIGKFNEAIGNRNAKVLEAEAEQIENFCKDNNIYLIEVYRVLHPLGFF